MAPLVRSNNNLGNRGLQQLQLDKEHAHSLVYLDLNANARDSASRFLCSRFSQRLINAFVERAYCAECLFVSSGINCMHLQSGHPVGIVGEVSKHKNRQLVIRWTTQASFLQVLNHLVLIHSVHSVCPFAYS